MSEKSKSLLKDFGGYALVIIAVITIRIFIFDPVRVDGPSMNNTLCDGEILILNKFDYRKNDVKRYDIVVVQVIDPFTQKEKKIVKRVIGLPNETIEIKNNKVYANGNLLDSSFTRENYAGEDFTLAEIGITKIQGDSYLVMGDNRGNSWDGREIGTIKKGQIVGKAVLRIWPLNKIGTIKNSNKVCKK